MRSYYFCLLLLYTIFPAPVLAQSPQSRTYASQNVRTHVLELFSSEGCSSCPPAESWLTELRKEKNLWKTFVPLQFHVDYWDNLGWPDHYATKDYTKRQTDYAREWGTGNVYTPEFVLDGKEWQNRSISILNAPAEEIVGRLFVEQIQNYRFMLKFSPLPQVGSDYLAHCSLLGNNLQTQVLRGENGGANLTHDFIVLAMKRILMRRQSKPFENTFVANIDFSDVRESTSFFPNIAQKSIVCWASTTTSLRPLQAVGGDLP